MLIIEKEKKEWEEKERDSGGFAASVSCLSSGSLYLFPGIAFMMADAVGSPYYISPSSWNPWSSCKVHPFPQLSSSSCPARNLSPFCRFDPPLSSTPNSFLLLLFNFVLTYSFGFLLTGNARIYGV
jgi:hypothetical protein